MSSSETNPCDCDPDILKSGRCVAVVTGGDANVIERFVKQIAGATGEPVDWHYVGGRAVVLATGDRDKVRAEIYRSRLNVSLYKDGAFVYGVFDQ